MFISCFQLIALYDAILENLDSIVDLHTDLTFKHYMFIELIEIASKHQDLELKPLVKTMMKYFGCDSDEDKSNFLRILLCYEKQEDICKESSVDQVK